MHWGQKIALACFGISLLTSYPQSSFAQTATSGIKIYIFDSMPTSITGSYSVSALESLVAAKTPETGAIPKLKKNQWIVFELPTADLDSSDPQAQQLIANERMDVSFSPAYSGSGYFAFCKPQAVVAGTASSCMYVSQAGQYMNIPNGIYTANFYNRPTNSTASAPRVNWGSAQFEIAAATTPAPVTPAPTSTTTPIITPPSPSAAPSPPYFPLASSGGSTWTLVSMITAAGLLAWKLRSLI